MSEVSLFPPSQRCRLQSKTYEAITRLFTLFDQHKQSLSKDAIVEPIKRDSDTEEGQISDSGDVEPDKKGSSGGKKEKRKRGAMTQGRKEKRRAKRRKQRAEQDKQNGVTRLKLEIVQKPKTVNYCKFFLYGKCQQGDACKFSHDTTPLTKARPCNFHAVGKCLKGVDCPYDHDLFNYPCDNYKTKGFCVRGDSCLFSHKPVAVDASSDVTGIQQDKGHPSLPRNLPVARRNDAAINNVNGAFDRLQNSNEMLARKPPQPPKGIGFLNFSTTPSKNFNNHQNGQLPVAGVNCASVDSTNNGPSERNQNTDVVLGRKATSSAQPPRGITFLTFQKTPSKMQNSELPVAQENGASKNFQNTNGSRRKPPLTFPSSQSSKMLAQEQDKHTSSPWTSKASCSTSWSTCDSKLTNPSIQPQSSNGNIPTVSSILQEFLFNDLGFIYVAQEIMRHLSPSELYVTGSEPG